MMEVLRNLFALFGVLVAVLASSLVFVAWRFYRAEKASKRDPQDQGIVQAVRDQWTDAVTADDPLWQHFPNGKRQQNGHAPKGWTL